MAEFLPLCDVLFNVISLAGYFCDIVFDMVFCYALLERGRTVYVGVVLLLVSASLVISQIVSLRWYLHKSRTRNAAAVGPSIGSLDKKKAGVTSATNGSAGETAEVSPVAADEHGSTSLAAAVPPTRRQRIAQYCVIGLHCSQLGVLWRYAKLFVPVDLRHVKHEVRDLCLLRLVHAFCEAAPMLLLQLHVLVTMKPEDYLIPLPEIRLKTLGDSGGSGETIGAAAAAAAAGLPNGLLVSTLSMGGQHSHLHLQHLHQPQAPLLLTGVQQRQLSTFRDLNVVSAMLSLFSVCWALASFSKNVRLQNVHRLVLTWLGVIFQFLWRLGTVVSRVTALTVYASLYGYWIFLVLVLHWFSMFLWLISPKNVFHGERISRVRKATLAALIAGVYVFAYVNLQQVKHRQKMVTFYVVMFLENWLLVCLWLVGVWPQRPENWWAVPALVLGSFAFGMGFMVLYYRYFHVRRLGYEAGGRFPGDPLCKYSGDPETGRVIVAGDLVHVDGTKNPAHAIPGVFNCRFSNPVGSAGTKRKKKKPTTFIPPPTLSVIPSSSVSQHSRGDHGGGGCGGSHSGSLADSCSQQGGLMSIPFWRRPLPRSNAGGSSENEGSAGSRVNIQQKLQEKKQKQLAELKIIEEEIKQGKLGGPLAGVAGHLLMDGSGLGMATAVGLSNVGLSADEAARCGSLMRQPIPRAKKHNNVEPIEWRSVSPGDTDDTSCGHPDLGSPLGGMNGGAVSAAATKAYNDLNGVLLSSSNLDEVNNLNKYTSNYDPLYKSFGLNSINIPALGISSGALQLQSDGAAPLSAAQAAVAGRNMSPISSQISATESNSLTRVVAAPRTKMLPARNPFAESYHRGGVGTSAYADGATAAGGGGSGGCAANAAPSISPRNTTDSPNRLLVANHPRQISGTYSSSIENSGVECLPFPYSVVPPPRSKLDSNGSPAGTMTTHATAPQGGGVPLQQTASGAGGGAGAINKSLNIQQQHLQQQQQQQRMIALRQMQRAKTPEILLAPHYLDNSRIYYDWVTREQQQSPSANTAAASASACGMQQMMQMMRPLPSYGADDLNNHQAVYQQQQHIHHHHPGHHMQLQHRLSSGDENLDDMDESVLSGEGAHCGGGGGGGHSDIDSQVSLPRSYTLPREFKYYRRNKTRKLIKNEHFITSTNSSDGDVDSGDDNESDATPTPLSGSVAANGNGAPPPPMIDQSGVAAPSTHHHNISHHHRALVNQSQRRLRPPTAAVRTHFQHQHQSPVAVAGNAAATMLHSSAASSPLSHQAAAYAASGRLMPVGAVAMPSYMQPQLQHAGVDGGPSAAHKPINHLDLIGIGGGPQSIEHSAAAAAAAANGGGGAANVMNRQMRLRLYGNSKGMGGGGMPRHETKL